MSKFDIFERFSETSRRVLVASQNIAKSMNSGVESPHLLFALTSTPGSLAYDILREQMISVDQIRLALQLEEFHSQSKNGLSDELKKVIELAALKAAEFNHFTIDSEHLLLAIVSDKTCQAYKIVEQIGVTPSIIRNIIENKFDEVLYIDELLPIGANDEKEEASTPELEPLREKLNMRTTTKSQKKQSETPALDYFTTDLTGEARRGELDPVIGRDAEILRAMQILCRRTKRNPLLIGDPGIGKTAIVEGLAQRIVLGQVPAPLKDKRIAVLDMALMIAGTTYRGQFEDRVKKIIDELVKVGNTILFIDEFHTMVGAGSAEGSLDMANIIKPSLAKGKLQVIGATTSDEYRKYIERDAALERRFQKIAISEPTEDETIAILEGIRGRYESFHNVTISDEAIISATFLASRYIADRFLPDKAIDLLDEAAAAVHMHNVSSPLQKEIVRLEQKLTELKHKKEIYLSDDQFESVGKLHAQELKLKDEISAKQKQTVAEQAHQVIGATEIAEIVARWTGIPVSDLVKEERMRLLQLEKILTTRVVGQEEAIKAVAKSIRRSRSGVADPTRPLGSFLFLGPTGVGKTELARALAELVFGKADSLVKVDMSEFMERHNVSRLLGAPPGYVGYEESGKLTEAVRKQPYSVVLFDEIEKAHPEVFNILLQIMEDGVITDGQGRRVSFRHAIIILTSNLGMQDLTTQAAIGFQSGEATDNEDYARIEEAVRQAVKETFAPEFINRLDSTIIFKPLAKSTLMSIVDVHTHELRNRLNKDLHIDLEVTQAAKELLADRGYDPEYGARPMKRAIVELIQDPLAEAVLAGKFKDGALIRVLRKGDKLVFRK